MTLGRTHPVHLPEGMPDGMAPCGSLRTLRIDAACNPFGVLPSRKGEPIRVSAWMLGVVRLLSWIGAY